MKRNGSKISARLKVTAAITTVIFTLLTVFTSTVAWFSTKVSANAGCGSFTVKPVSGIQYDLYYLHHFEVNNDDKDGNYNSIFSIYSGYEVAEGTPVFEQVRLDDNGNALDEHGDIIVDPTLNPTNISNLWPAHRLTYAIVISSGDFQSFSLESWTDGTNENVVAHRNNGTVVEISLSWATNLYGAAFNVTKSYVDPQAQEPEEDLEAELASGFASYTNPQTTLTDVMGYHQDNCVVEPKPVLPITTTTPGTPTSAQRQILYFSIEFDDDESTYYELSYDEENDPTHLSPFYVKSTDGNSNCYKGLSLSNLVFKLA